MHDHSYQDGSFCSILCPSLEQIHGQEGGMRRISLACPLWGHREAGVDCGRIVTRYASRKARRAE